MTVPYNNITYIIIYMIYINIHIWHCSIPCIEYKRTSDSLCRLWWSLVEKRGESNKRKNMIAFKTIILYYIYIKIYINAIIPKTQLLKIRISRRTRGNTIETAARAMRMPYILILYYISLTTTDKYCQRPPVINYLYIHTRFDPAV